jgi:hypothetical protein
MGITDATSTENGRPLPEDERRQAFAGVAPRTGFLLLETDRQLIRENAHAVREALFSCSTRPQVECAVAFARYLSFSGLNADNYWLFLRLVMTNNPWVVDELMRDRVPRLLFSTVRPDRDLLDAAFEMLFSRHPDEMYDKALECVLGIIQNAYFDPDDGYRIRKLSIMDINALGKFLIKDEVQDHPLNKLILEILDKITHVGEYYGEQDKNVLSKHAFNVRYAYFDHTRELVDAIPEPLLVRMNDITGVPPEEDFVDLMSNRKESRRDVHGRFVKGIASGALPEIADRVPDKTPPSVPSPLGVQPAAEPEAERKSPGKGQSQSATLSPKSGNKTPKQGGSVPDKKKKTDRNA